jgi:OHCU decarboxylase
LRISELNALSEESAEKEFLAVCGSKRWAKAIVLMRPFKSADDLYAQAELVWNKMTSKDWLEAFKKHPRIGDLKSAQGAAAKEQAGVSKASKTTREELERCNIEYDKKFGFVFLICATGRTADYMLLELKNRLKNTLDQEIANAKYEQAKITRIRLEKLLNS